MKIKKFNESVEYNELEQKAIDAGYSVGDVVYNHITKDRMTIVKDSNEVIGDKNCTLGAVGENPSTYSKVEQKYQVSPKRDHIKQSKIFQIKNNIHDLIIGGYMVKGDLKEIIDEYINKIK
jgi:hypothetical protein